MSKVPITPLHDYVVAKQDEAVTRTKSGLYIPEKAAEKPKTATILAIGTDVKDIKVGDKVIYGGYTNNEVKHDGVDYILIKSENIYAKIS